MTSVFGLWIYLSTTPLFWLTVTLLAWLAADALAKASGRHPVANAVLIAATIVGALVLGSETSYRTYFDGAQFIHFLLGPATVALGIPLYRNRALVLRNLVPMMAALLAGAAVSIGSALGIAAALGAPRDVLASLAPKSVTTPVAMAVSERLGGQPSLTAALVILTGILGAVMVTPLMNALRMTDFAARGFAAGLAAHGIGTARAFTVDSVAGTFAGIALGLNALVTAVLAPMVLGLF
ncbi:LrgB family protein [Lichenibacterium minor]|uniref:LrgB family protein n=1 Tax=Lichenibacterium minor TaxID=2316528 RepID=A0A4Q2U847_9HYPH|nr:LrgB family protein [Lichenibacterium minor]RYC31035.1 LrgB family protein [Lichenibacterium minor]